MRDPGDETGRLAGALATRWAGRPLHALPRCASTNDVALALARDGATHGTVVLADEQTAGRGQKGRAWHSPPGKNVYLSLVLRPALPPHAAPPLTLAAGVAVHDALAALGATPAIKWPNDVRIAGRKVAGILIETVTRGARLEAAVIGVGVNVNLHPDTLPPELAAVATSLSAALGRDVDRARVVDGLLHELEDWVDRFVGGGPGAIVDAWQARSETSGLKVRLPGPGVRWATARDLDPDGALVVVEEDGAVHRLWSAEVE